MIFVRKPGVLFSQYQQIASFSFLIQFHLYFLQKNGTLQSCSYYKPDPKWSEGNRNSQKFQQTAGEALHLNQIQRSVQLSLPSQPTAVSDMVLALLPFCRPRSLLNCPKQIFLVFPKFSVFSAANLQALLHTLHSIKQMWLQTFSYFSHFEM